jgi:hypothetical protein
MTMLARAIPLADIVSSDDARASIAEYADA